MNQNQKFKLLTAVLLSATGLSFSISAFSAAGDTGTSAKSSRAAATGKAAQTQAWQDMRASQLIGKDVRSTQGERLGEIKDLIVDVGNDRARYAILEFGGFLGFGEKLFAYPVRAFSMARDGALILNVPKERLNSAPGFARDTWPDWVQYGSAVDRYFGLRDQEQVARNQKLHRATELIGKRVQDRAGANAGDLADLVVNLGNGKVHYAVLALDKAWSANDKLLPLPLTAFTFNTPRDPVILNVPKASLNMAQSFDKNRWPNVSDARYSADIDRYLTSVLPAAIDTARTSAGPDRDSMFDRLDTDRDGFISRTEADRDPQLRQSFQSLDRNRDGRVSRSEFMEQQQRMDQQR